MGEWGSGATLSSTRRLLSAQRTRDLREQRCGRADRSKILRARVTAARCYIPCAPSQRGRRLAGAGRPPGLMTLSSCLITNRTPPAPVLYPATRPKPESSFNRRARLLRVTRSTQPDCPAAIRAALARRAQQAQTSPSAHRSEQSTPACRPQVAGGCPSDIAPIRYSCTDPTTLPLASQREFGGPSTLSYCKREMCFQAAHPHDAHPHTPCV